MTGNNVSFLHSSLKKGLAEYFKSIALLFL